MFHHEADKRNRNISACTHCRVSCNISNGSQRVPFYDDMTHITEKIFYIGYKKHFLLLSKTTKSLIAIAVLLKKKEAHFCFVNKTAIKIDKFKKFKSLGKVF